LNISGKNVPLIFQLEPFNSNNNGVLDKVLWETFMSLPSNKIKGLSDNLRTPTRLGKWTKRQRDRLAYKFRAIFEVEAHPDTMGLSEDEKVIKAQEILNDYIESWRELHDVVNYDKDLTIKLEDISKFNYRLLRESPALRSALTLRTMEYLEIVNLRDDIIIAMVKAREKLKNGDINATVKFWKWFSEIKKGFEHFLRLDETDVMRREILALRKAYKRSQEELVLLKERESFANENSDGSVIRVIMDDNNGMKELEKLLNEN